MRRYEDHKKIKTFHLLLYASRRWSPFKSYISQAAGEIWVKEMKIPSSVI